MNFPVTVIIVTYNRQDCVRKCLAALAIQTRQPEQIIVVDGSPHRLTADVVADFPGVLYLRNERGSGHMTMSRNIGLRQATGQVIAFVDDDAYAEADWLERLLEGYQSSDVAAVGGRAIQGGRPPEPWVEIDKIGTLRPHGELYAGFDTDCKQIIRVDHMIGCNMSFRREVVAELGGFRDDFPGTEVCEESDMSLRIGKLVRPDGSRWRIMYQPAAVVHHVGAPQFKGRRFDARYNYYSAHNNSMLLLRNFGLFQGIYLRFLLRSLYDRARDWVKSWATLSPRVILGQTWRMNAYSWGLFVGVLSGLCRAGNRLAPQRQDEEGKRIRTCLQGSPQSPDAMPVHVSMSAEVSGSPEIAKSCSAARRAIT